METSRRLGFRQFVARSRYLLNVVLTNVQNCKASPHSDVAENKNVVVTVAFRVPEAVSHTREVW